MCYNKSVGPEDRATQECDPSAGQAQSPERLPLVRLSRARGFYLIGGPFRIRVFLRLANLREQITQTASNAVERLRVRSALNPALWLCFIVTAPALVATPFFPTAAPSWFIITALTPVLLAALGFLVLLFWDRDKLQSEDYQLRKQSLELIQEKGASITIDPASINSIANPDVPRRIEGQ